MNSFFSDPRTQSREPRRRQERRDFFPSFSDSLFSDDPFSSLQSDGSRSATESDFEHPLYQQTPQKHHRNQHQQQPQQQPQQPQQRHHQKQQQQHQRSDRSRTAVNQQGGATQPHRNHHKHHNQQDQPHPQQQHRHQQARPPRQQTLQQQNDALKHQQTPHQKRQSGGQRQRLQQRSRPVEAEESADDLETLVKGAFGDVTSAPTHQFCAPASVHQHRELPQSTESSEATPEEEHQRDDDEDADLDREWSEEEEMKPDPEVQARSNKELSEIRWNLEDLATELDQILTGVIKEKRRILLTEENLTKAMLKIDSVDSGGDDSIRKQRKHLINRVEELLEMVDEFKHRTKTSVPQKAV